jgi:GTP-binding protein HflX
LVGYTNVGKSTLFNFLTGAGVLSADQLFATLDPTMRGVVLPSGSKIILSDTVGFIAELPTQLVEAFRATLEEVLEADLILHVHDLADPEHIIQAEDVKMVLAELGIDRGSKKIIDVYNKVDIANVKDIDLVQPAINSGQAIAVSAVTGEGAEVLLSSIDEALAANGSEVVVRISCAAGDALAYLYRTAFSISSESDGEDVIVRAKLAKSDLARFVKQWSGTAIIEAARSPN